MLQNELKGGREIQTVMHELKQRQLVVKEISDLTPSLRNIVFKCDELAGFTSLSPDDHIKVFFPNPDVGSAPSEQPAIMRDYTPRRVDLEKGELTLEFALHGKGVGSNWAAQAVVGQRLTIGGPRGSKVVPYSFDWYLMIGDESALPSFARRLEEMPSGSKAIVIVEVQDAANEAPLQLSDSTEIVWVHRHKGQTGDVQLLSQALDGLKLPPGDPFIWISTEKKTAFALKEVVLARVATAKPEWMKVTGYWVRETEFEIDSK